MAEFDKTVLEAINHLITRHPELAERVEAIAASVQGKGWGAGTVGHEAACAIQALGRSPALTIDIGGNVGNYAAEIRTRAAEAEIHIFEPSAANIAKLKSRFETDNRVLLNQAAVSGSAGEAKLYSNQIGSTLGSLTKRRVDHFNISFDKEESVETVRFEDYWIKKLDRRSIDIAKLDIEGHELDALDGFGEALKATKIVQFEFGGANIDTRTFFQDFWYFFSERNFDLFRINPYGANKIIRYQESDEYFSTTNYLAINRQ